MSITLTATQAESLAEHGLFVVEGVMGVVRLGGEDRHRIIPPGQWVEADQPCENRTWIAGEEERCPECHGSGRKVVELVTRCERCDGMGTLDLTSEEISLALEGNTETWVGDDQPGTDDCDRCDGTGHRLLGEYTIQVLPIVGEGYQGPWPVVFTGNGESYLVPHEYRIKGGWEEQPTTLPPDAKPGQFAVIATEVGQ